MLLVSEEQSMRNEICKHGNKEILVRQFINHLLDCLGVGHVSLEADSSETDEDILQQNPFNSSAPTEVRSNNVM